MRREDVKVGMRIQFGRPNGEKTLAVVERVNPATARVRTLEERGVAVYRPAGQIWNVPYSLMYPAPDEAGNGETGGAGNGTTGNGASRGAGSGSGLPGHGTLKYDRFAVQDNLIIEAIVGVYCDLSPENLTCDGELSRSQVRAREAALLSRLRGLQTALGRKVSESEAFDWDTQKRDAEKAAAASSSN